MRTVNQSSFKTVTISIFLILAPAKRSSIPINKSAKRSWSMRAKAFLEPGQKARSTSSNMSTLAMRAFSANRKFSTLSACTIASSTRYIVRNNVIGLKNWNVLMVVILLLNATFFVMQLALAKEESIITSSNKTEHVSFVESAVAYAQENGKDKALDEFSNKTGSFVRGDLYIYAYDFNGTNIAHPFKPDWISMNKSSETDSNTSGT
jgi:hypothetical protein